MKKLSIFVLVMIVSLAPSGMALAQTIVVWDREVQTEQTVALFNAKMEAEGSPKRAEFQLVPYEQQTQLFLAALAAGNAPDVISLDIILHPYFNSIGAFLDITDRIEALEYRSALPEGMLHLGEHEGRYYGIPYTVDLSGLVWNKTLFREAGLDPERPPQTWDELIEYAQVLTKDLDNDGETDQYGFGIVGTSAGWQMFGFMPVVWSYGGDLLNSDGTEVLIDSPESIEALQMWVDLIHKYKVAPINSATWQYSDVYNGFVTGRIAMMLSGNYNIITFQDDAPDLDFGITFIPRAAHGQHASFSGGNLMAISRDTKQVDLAWEFVEFAMSEDIQVEVWAKSGALPVRTDLFDNKYFAKDPRFAVFADILEVARAPYSTKYNELYAPMLTAMQRAMMGEISPEQAYQDAARDMKRALEY
jgi:multiple sugar transport system substrate-binding protein